MVLAGPGECCSADNATERDVAGGFRFPVLGSGSETVEHEAKWLAAASGALHDGSRRVSRLPGR